MMNPHLRWMIRRDYPELMEIERLAFDPTDRWSEDEYRRLQMHRDVIGMVAEARKTGHGDWEPIVGLIIYRTCKDRIEILRLATHVGVFGRGVGRAILDKMQAKLLRSRHRLTLDVPEDFLGAHLFLKACGFRATRVDRDGAGYGRDLYRFEHRLSDAVAEPAHLDWCERLRRAAIDGGIAARPGWFMAFSVLQDAAPLAAGLGQPAVPLPSIHPGDDGRVRLTWRRDGRSVHLHAGADGAEVRLDPEAFPGWVHATSTTAECLARALGWIFLDSQPTRAPAPAPAEEDRSC